MASPSSAAAMILLEGIGVLLFRLVIAERSNRHYAQKPTIPTRAQRGDDLVWDRSVVTSGSLRRASATPTTPGIAWCGC